MPTREKIVLLIYTLLNAISNHFVGFYSDENYYWLWSKKLDLSYFDHPPMIAYIIKLTTLMSDDPFFVRLGAVFLVSASIYLLYALAKRMFDEKTAIYTFYVSLSSIIIIVASTLITPDIPLFFFSTLLLYAAYIYLFEDKKNYALLTGVAAGAMLLSKYTGILIIFTLLLFILFYKREKLKDKYFYFALIIATALFSPVLYWNYLHDFISFTFQIHHGIAQEKIFNPQELSKFFGAQLALFHPFYLLPLFFFILRDKERFTPKKVYLLLPFLFVLFFFTYNSAFKHANAQWAGPAYISAAILMGYYLAKFEYKKLLTAGLILSSIIFVALKTPLLAQYIYPLQKLHARLGKIDNFKQEIEALHLDIESYDYILIDDYHGAEVPYFFKKTDNILVLNTARFSNFNIWRNEDLNISQESPLTSIPSLGNCIYIGRQASHYKEIAKLFKDEKLLAEFHKKVAHLHLDYYVVELSN